MKNLAKILTVFILFTQFVFSSALNLSMSSSPTRLNPILANDSASSEISQWIFRGLFKYDKNGNPQTDIAKSYKFETDTKLIIKLKDNVFWHDGKKLSAKDVIFTYKQIINPKVFNSIKSNFSEVKSVKALDDYTIEVIYKRAYFKAIEIWMIGLLPEHILKDEKDLMTSSFNKKPIGNGPYKIDGFSVGKDIELKANKNFYMGKPTIEKIFYKFVPDPNTSFLLLKQNKLDLGALTSLQIDRQLNKKFLDSFDIYEKQSLGYTYLGFNLRKEKFKNKKIREAIAYAINKQELVDILFFGHGKICNGPFLPGSFAFNKNTKNIEQNIKKSKALLKELGYDENNPLTFEVVTNTGNDTRVNAAEIIQYQLARAGINMKIRVMEWQAFLNTVVHPRNFEAIILGWNLTLMPDAYSIWHSKSNKKGGFNLVGYENKEVDNLIEQGSITVNREKLGFIYRDIFDKISKDLPYIFLYIPNSISAINKNIRNVESAFIGIRHNQEYWIKE